MCGAPKTQEIVTRTELDPNLQRLLYGGIFPGPPTADPMGGGMDMAGGGGGGGRDRNRNRNSDFQFGANQRSPSFASSNARSFLPGGVNTQDPSSNINRAAAALFDRPQSPPTAANSRPVSRPSGFGIENGKTVRLAMGGMVPPQQGLASLNQGQMPMVNGQMPNLSDPMMAATLAMAMRSPQMQYGSIAQNPMMQTNFNVGGYVEGPGTGTSDSIDSVILQNGQPVQRAKLSDGEFVMTENAVKGAGNGDREAGAARMYELMRQFERGGRV